MAIESIGSNAAVSAQLLTSQSQMTNKPSGGSSAAQNMTKTDKPWASYNKQSGDGNELGGVNVDVYV
jgi:hypothetical protein